MHRFHVAARAEVSATGTGARNSAAAEIRRTLQATLRHGAPERISERLERSRRWAYEQTEGASTLALEYVAEALHEVPDATAQRALALLAEPRGYLVLPAPGMTETRPAGLLRLASEVTAALSRFTGAISGALEDDKVEPHEVSHALVTLHGLRTSLDDAERALLDGAR